MQGEREREGEVCLCTLVYFCLGLLLELDANGSSSSRNVLKLSR